MSRSCFNCDGDGWEEIELDEGYGICNSAMFVKVLVKLKTPVTVMHTVHVNVFAVLGRMLNAIVGTTKR